MLDYEPIAERYPMGHDVEGMIGAERYERGDDSQTYRNGYRDRALKTRMGSLNLRGHASHRGEDVLADLRRVLAIV